MGRAYTQVRERVGDMLAAISESVVGAATIRAYGVEERTAARIDAAVEAHRKAAVGAQIRAVLQHPLESVEVRPDRSHGRRSSRDEQDGERGHEEEAGAHAHWTTFPGRAIQTRLGGISGYGRRDDRGSWRLPAIVFLGRAARSAALCLEQTFGESLARLPSDGPCETCSLE